MSGPNSPFRAYLEKRRAEASSPQDRSPLDTPLKVTFFGNQFASTKTEGTLSLRQLVERIRETQAPSKAQLPWLKLAAFGNHRTPKGSLRSDENVLEIHGIEADYDGEQITVGKAKQIIMGARLAAVIYTSPSHTPEKPRWRVLCPTSEALPPESRAELVARVNGLFVGALAQESFTLSQSYYYGRVTGSEDHEVEVLDGRPIDLATELKDAAIGRPQKPAPAPQAPRHTAARPRLQEGGTPYGLTALENECEAIRTAPDGTKHATLNKAAYAIGGLVAARELDEGLAFSELSAALQVIRTACKDFRAAERTLQRSFQDGMGRPRDVPDRPAPVQEEVHPAAAFLAKIAEKAKAQPLPPAPVDPGLMDVDGALKLFIDHCEATAISPQPFLALAAAITLVGVLAGRKYRTTTDLRTNIYAVGICDSGGGKDHARKRIRKVLYAADLQRYLGGSDIASGSGMRTALQRHPATVFLVDEFGNWLKGVLGDKAPAHKAQIAALLKELYSSANTILSGTEYADQSRQGKPREDIHQPHACLYATTTPKQFWDAVGGANLQDGLMARLLLFLSPDSYPDDIEGEIAEPGPELVAAMRSVALGAGPRPSGDGNLPEIFSPIMAAGTEPDPYTVPETDEATAARKALRREQLEKQRKAEGTWITSIEGRFAENTMKLALVRAVSRDPADPIIGVADIAWGRAVTRHCLDTLLREAGQNVADTDYERKTQRLMSIIRKHGPVTDHAIFDRHRFGHSARERTEMLNDLIRLGMVIAVEPDPTKPGPKRVKYMVAPAIHAEEGAGN